MPVPTTPSVDQQILDQLVQTAIDQLGLAHKDVQRPGREGNQVQADAGGNMPDAWLLITAGQEDAVESDGAVGMNTWSMPVTVDCHLIKIPDGVDLDTYAKRWNAALVKAFLIDPQRTDTNGVELALDTHLRGKFGPVAVDEMRDVLCGLELEIQYRHPFADPYTVG